MDVTLFIGNGFDKALELKTGYYDFYNWLNIQQTDAEYISLMRKVHSEIGVIFNAGSSYP